MKPTTSYLSSRASLCAGLFVFSSAALGCSSTGDGGAPGSGGAIPAAGGKSGSGASGTAGTASGTAGTASGTAGTASMGGGGSASTGASGGGAGAPMSGGASNQGTGGTDVVTGGGTSSGGSAGSAGSTTVDNVTNPEPNEIIGFGSKTTGGKGGKEVVVTTAEALKAAAESTEPMIITVKGQLVHNVSGGDDNARIFVKSNKTIQGADATASVDANFNAVGADNVIFRNLNISNEEGKGTGDGIEFTKVCTNIWVDHVTFGQCKDGAMDFKKGSDHITVSWCKFAYTSASHAHNYANLIGHDDTETTDRGTLHVTMHHNWYAKNVIERMPRVRYGRVHVFNNYYSSERTNYVVGVGVESEILLEASYFEKQGAQTWYDWSTPNKCVGACAPGKIQWTPDNVFDNTTISTWAPNSDVFDPPYKYLHVKQSAANAKASVMERAGAH